MDDLAFRSPPRISLAQFTAVLRIYRSPALPAAAACYAICARQGLDPAVALAFFAHESSCGTRGAARQTLNWGNLRASMGAAWTVSGGWAWYRTWEASLTDWCALIQIYCDRGAGRQKGTPLPTVRLALAEYAPGDDDNDPAGYASAVIALVARWQAADPAPVAPVDPWADWGTRHPLDPARYGWKIPAAWRQHGGLGEALSEEIYADDGRISCQIFTHGVITYWAALDRCTIVRHP